MWCISFIPGIFRDGAHPCYVYGYFERIKYRGFYVPEMLTGNFLLFLVMQGEVYAEGSAFVFFAGEINAAVYEVEITFHNVEP